MYPKYCIVLLQKKNKQITTKKKRMYVPFTDLDLVQRAD